MSNPYEEMGLVSEKTNLVQKILKSCGNTVKTGKEGKSGKKEGKGQSKGGAKKKGASAKNNMDTVDYYEFKFLPLDEEFKKPCFRYIPDRKTMQRLVFRVADFAYDLVDLVD